MPDEEHVRQSSLVKQSNILLTYLHAKSSWSLIVCALNCILQVERLCKCWQIRLTQNTVNPYNMDSSNEIQSSIWIYTPAPWL